MAFPFELLSDAEEKACAIFGVIKMKNMYGKKVRGIERSTFVVDKSGAIAKAWRGVKVPGHAQEVLDFVKSA
jgi:thioredoxin-dependent peroxiredoxin